PAVVAALPHRPRQPPARLRAGGSPGPAEARDRLLPPAPHRPAGGLDWYPDSGGRDALMLTDLFAGTGRRPPPAYARRPPLVLINGLAEQAESWYGNLDAWRRHFEVYQPNLLAYEGAALHRRLDAGLPVDVPYLVERLHEYLDGFVQAPPYHQVANSLGGKVAVEITVRYPELVGRLALPCPAGLRDAGPLPRARGRGGGGAAPGSPRSRPSPPPPPGPRGAGPPPPSSGRAPAAGRRACSAPSAGRTRTASATSCRASPDRRCSSSAGRTASWIRG